MANSGPNTNTSQLYRCHSHFAFFFNTACFYSFITFRPCKHLDKKHTIFGAVVGGLGTALYSIGSFSNKQLLLVRGAKQDGEFGNGPRGQASRTFILCNSFV
jgi:cyclophilin family peptidyl-prolyl cis-trans isomerase